MRQIHVIQNLRLAPHTIFQSTHLSQDLTRKSVHSGLLTIISHAMRFVLSIISTVILARLLTPYDFGLMGMATVIIGFIAILKNAGLSIATIQSAEITSEQISFLFWLNLLISAVLGCCLIVAAPLIAMVYQQPELTKITLVLSVSFIISGLTIQHQALLYRHMRFGALASIQIAAQVVTLILMIALAQSGWTYWSLVIGSFFSTLFITLLTFFFCPWIPHYLRKGFGVRSLLTFGGNLTVGNVANYLSVNMDNVLIGRFIGADALGLYSKPYQLLVTQTYQFKESIQVIALSALSSLKNQPDRFSAYYLRFLDLLASLLVPSALYCAIEAEFLVNLLLGPQWLEAVAVFRTFAFVILLYPLAETQGVVLVSLGRSRQFLIWRLLYAFLAILSFAMGLPFGITGVAVAFAVMNYITLIPSLLYCFHETPITVVAFLKTIAPALFVSAIAGAMALLVKYAVGTHSFALHMVVLGVFAGTYAGLSSYRTSLRELPKLLLPKPLSLPKDDYLGEKLCPKSH